VKGSLSGATVWVVGWLVRGAARLVTSVAAPVSRDGVLTSVVAVGDAGDAGAVDAEAAESACVVGAAEAAAGATPGVVGVATPAFVAPGVLVLALAPVVVLVVAIPAARWGR
jgi:hypothetical protein